MASSEPYLRNTTLIVASIEPYLRVTTLIVASSEPYLRNTTLIVASSEPYLRNTTLIVASSEPYLCLELPPHAIRLSLKCTASAAPTLCNPGQYNITITTSKIRIRLSFPRSWKLFK